MRKTTQGPVPFLFPRLSHFPPSSGPGVFSFQISPNCEKQHHLVKGLFCILTDTQVRPPEICIHIRTQERSRREILTLEFLSPTPAPFSSLLLPQALLLPFL